MSNADNADSAAGKPDKNAIVIRPGDELEGLFFPKEGNTILYPLFAIGKRLGEESGEGRPIKKQYSVEVRGKRRTFEIHCTLGVPSEFEYDVFNAILALRAISDVGEEGSIVFNAKDIIRMLKLTDSGTNYKRIDEAVRRLTLTDYVFDEFFERKVKPENGLFPIDEAEFDGLGEFDPIDDALNEDGKIKVNASHAADGSITVTSNRFVTVKLFIDSAGLVDTKQSGETIRAGYRLQFHPRIVKSLKAKFSRRFEVARFFQLKNASLRRFYEIISFESHKHQSFSFQYEVLSSLIPLSSGRMNKQYIIGYAKKLKEGGYITDFDSASDKDRINILFRPQNVQASYGASGSVWNEKDCEEFKRKASSVFEKRGLDAEFDAEEFLKIASHPESNPLSLTPGLAVENLIYVLYRRNRIRDSVQGYFRSALISDYAAAKREKKKKQGGPAGVSQFSLDVGSGDATKPVRKGPPDRAFWEAFDKFASALSDDDRVKIETELGIGSVSGVKAFQKRKFVERLAELGYPVEVPTV